MLELGAHDFILQNLLFSVFVIVAILMGVESFPLIVGLTHSHLVVTDS